MEEPEKNDILIPSIIDEKKITFIHKVLTKVFPDFLVYDTYRDKEFARLTKSEKYAENLDHKNSSIKKFCNVSPNIHISEAAFLSHAKRQSFSLPYSGGVRIPKNSVGKSKLNNNTPFIDKINMDFHMYAENRAKFLGSISNMKNGIQVSPEEKDIEKFILKRLSQKILPNSNDIILITGDIGCGKSTLITNCLYKVLFEQANNMQERKKNYIRVEQILIDFEDLSPPDTNDKDLKTYIEEVINTKILDKIKSQLFVKGANFESVIKKIPRNTRLILAFDNLDTLYTEFCKKLFISNSFSNNEVEIQKYYPFIYKLIFHFTLGKYSHLGIRCIFAARNETVELLENGLCIDDGDRSPFEAINTHIKLTPTTGEYISEVIEKRINLIGFNLDDKDEKSQLTLNQNKLTKQATMFQEINLLSIQGLRHTMSVCKKLSWSLSDKRTFQRFFIDGVATRIFHYLGGKTNYSQVHEGIANIFLVNNKYRLENNQLDGNGKPLFKNEDLEDHLHTYWLKYFILLYICNNNVNKTNVINFFSNNNKTGYPPNLIKLLVYSLSEIKHGRLIRPQITFGNGCSVASSGLECTKRAKYLIENNSFWSFCYLSLIIEDEWLEYPISEKNQFSHPIGFDFLFCSDQYIYREKFGNYLINKSGLVLLFLDILETSLKFEKEKYTEVFSLLKTHEIAEPNFKAIRKNVIKRITELSSQNLSDKQQKEVSKVIRKTNGFIYRRRLKNRLSKTFKKAYYTGYIGRMRLALCS